MPALEAEIPIDVFFDIDGVLKEAPVAGKTVVQLIRRKFKPSPERPVTPYCLPTGFRGQRGIDYSISSHTGRPPKVRALEGVRDFLLTGLVSGRKLSLGILSGREPFLHGLTLEELKKERFLDYIHSIYLCNSVSSGEWKVFMTGRKLAEGHKVVTIEDDTRPAVGVANQALKYPEENRVLVYLVNSLASDPRLLRWAGVVLPENVVRVKDVPAAATDFRSRLAAGVF